jgi:hypothetical protein
MVLEDETVPGRLPDRGILVLGRRAAGKTVFMARLYEALWSGASFVDGSLVPAGERPPPGATTVQCRAFDGATHAYLMGAAQELQQGRWPTATIGRTWLDLAVQHGGQTHRLSMLDYPGEAFRRAFMHEDLDPDSTALRAAVLGASAVIILVDPGVIAENGSGALEDTFGMLQAVALIRRRENGFQIPIALVFTKTDANLELLNRSGGVRNFVVRHFKHLYQECRRVRIFSCAAVRTVNRRGETRPHSGNPPGNVLEPLVYCLRRLEGLDRSTAYRDRLASESARVEAPARGGAIDPRLAWALFIISVGAAFAGAVFFALWYTAKQAS